MLERYLADPDDDEATLEMPVPLCIREQRYR